MTYFDPYEQRRANSPIHADYMRRWQARTPRISFETALTIAVLLYFAYLTLGCDIARPGTTPITLTQEQQDEYYGQLQVRIRGWFGGLQLPVPDLPDQSLLYARVRVVEFASTPGSTCYFSSPDRVEIGDDKWQSGCVPHELGHAALYMTGHPCWNEFEHPGEEAECLASF